jgi:hypothetical protein
VFDLQQLQSTLMDAVPAQRPATLMQRQLLLLLLLLSAALDTDWGELLML